MAQLATEAVHEADGHHIGHGHSPPRPFTRLRQLLLPEHREIWTVLVFAFSVAILSLATPIAVESLVNTVAFGVLMWPVVIIAGVLMACLGLAAAIRAMQVYVIECLQRRLFVRVVSDYAHRLPHVKLEAFDHHYGPELGNRFFDVLTVQKKLAVLLLDGLALIVTAGVGMTVLAFYHPYLLGFAILLIMCVAFIVFVLGLGGIRTCLHESHTKFDVAAWLEELLRCMRTFKFAGGQQLAFEKADQLAGEYVTARRAHFRVVWRQTLFALGLQVVASTVLLGLGGFLVINRQLTLGQLVAAELIVTLIVASVAKIGKYTEAFYDLMAASEKLGVLTDLPLEREGGESLEMSGSGMELRLHGVDHVSHRKLPCNVDWHVAPNERVAIVGSPGSGKTTLFEALCALREPSHGVIKLDGINLRELSLQHLREQTALVAGPEFFLGSVRDNVRVGRPNLSLAEIRQAIHAVGLTEVVHALPNGLNTPLTPDGGPLSASHALRLAIARALAGRPRLLVIDGVLDRIDLQDCPEMLTVLFDRAAPWTLLVASANPVVVGMCDRTIHLAEAVEA